MSRSRDCVGIDVLPSSTTWVDKGRLFAGDDEKPYSIRIESHDARQPLLTRNIRVDKTVAGF